uniref:NADH-ubiquinone oxidoreductase chain 6 n=1 Tax=Staphylinidae sp. BMNH 1274207 TaxID=1796558 RepID=A0A140EGS6_9COLE|nr:NADH dehydrogenase subunit 6 [Staphylinidae sp. BMNH 1274207]
MNLFIFLNLFLSICMLFMNHPMSMGMILLTQTIMITLITGLMTMNFWYSYILFLVMIGGMLILFIYMTSIASNEKFKFSFNFFFTMSFMILLILMFFMINYFYYPNWNIESINFNNNNYISLNKFINEPFNIMLSIIIIYLFITLIAVVKITKMKFGPLRQKF